MNNMNDEYDNYDFTNQQEVERYSNKKLDARIESEIEDLELLQAIYNISYRNVSNVNKTPKELNTLAQTFKKAFYIRNKIEIPRKLMTQCYSKNATKYEIFEILYKSILEKQDHIFTLNQQLYEKDDI